MTIRLPGGAGQLSGTNADPIQTEQFRSRQRENPQFNEWYFSAVPLNIQFVNAGVTANLPRIVGAMHLYEGINVKYAKCNVAVANAAALLRSAIYRCNGTEFIMVAGTKAEFDSSSTGQKSVEFNSIIQLNPGFYFMGIYSNDGTARWAGGDGNRGSRGYRVTGATDLWDRIKINDMTSTVGLGIPQVIYMSIDAEKVL